MQLSEIKKVVPPIPRRHRPEGKIGQHQLITAPRNKKTPDEEQGYHHWLVDKDGKALEYSDDYKAIQGWRAKYRQPVKESAQLNEAYEDRVQQVARHLISTFKDQPGTKEEVLAALHKYCVADPDGAAAEHNRRVIHDKTGAFMPNGVSDYNGSAKFRKEFVNDVLIACREMGMKFARVFNGRTSSKPKKDDEYFHRIYSKVTDFVGQTFPDGDPIDRIGPWLERSRIPFEDVDRAFRREGQHSYHRYLADMWQDLADGAVHDAENGHVDQHSPFYHVAKDGSIEISDNPWESSDEAAKRVARKARAHAKMMKARAKPAKGEDDEGQ